MAQQAVRLLLALVKMLYLPARSGECQKVEAFLWVAGSLEGAWR